MKKILLFLILLSFTSTYAQNNAKDLNDYERLTINAYISEDVDNISKNVRVYLLSKIQHIISEHGLGGGINSRFIMTSSISTVNKEITSTAPPMFAMVLNVNFYIGDGYSGVLYATNSLTVKGVGSTEDKAYINAINNIKSNQSLADFINKGKNRIIDYYNSQCDFIQKNAFTLAAQDKYDQAIFELISVPAVCKGCYMKSMDNLVEIYKRKLERECQSLVVLASSLVAQNEYDKAALVLSTVLPGISCYSEAKNLLDKIDDHRFAAILGKARGSWASKNIEETSFYLGEIPADSKYAKEALVIATQVRKWAKEKDNREWQFELKKHDDNVDIRKLSIQASREIAVAYAAHQPAYLYNIKGWW